MTLYNGKENYAMNGNRLLLDTNILIYLSRKEVELDFFANSNDMIGISVITYMEALGFLFKFKKEENIMEALCQNLDVIQLDDKIVSLVIALRKEGRIKLPDAIILATAIANDMFLVTHNLSDFSAFSSRIRIIDPVKV
jgi:predicted nucleic acid-binding protein